MSERSYSSGDGYRFGFNGMEKDDEVKGDGNSLDFGARVYDSRLGRWYSIDKHPKLHSNYSFAINSPISVIDPDGNDEFLYVQLYKKNSQGKLELIQSKQILVSQRHAERVTFDENDKLKTNYYDVFHISSFVIDEQGNVTLHKKGSLLSQDPVYSRSHPWTFIPRFRNLEGEGESRPGGSRLTRESGGISPTKNTTEENVGTIDADGMIGLIGNGMTGLSKPNIAEIVDLVSEILQQSETLQKERFTTVEVITKIIPHQKGESMSWTYSYETKEITVLKSDIQTVKKTHENEALKDLFEKYPDANYPDLRENK